MRYLPLWAVLAISFVIFALVSFVDHPTVFGHEFKTMGFAESIFSERKSAPGPALPEEMESEDEEVAIAEHSFPMPLDTASKTILFIGDSMLEGLGPRLAAYADHNGHTLYEVMWYSSTSDKWGSSDRLGHYISKIKPSYIFICLGANELFVPDIINKRKDKVASIISTIGEIPYVWIGPPNWKKDTGINRLIEECTPEGAFFLSDGMSFDRTKDGAHPTRNSAALWLDSVARWMPEHALHPIKMDKPDKESSKAKRIYIHQPNE